MAPQEISLATVKEHNTPKSLWIVIEDKVYDVSKFRNEHPGGEDVLDEVGGRDATKEFVDVGHSTEAKQLMQKFYIGDLAVSDRKSKLPLREIGLAVGAVVIGIATVFLIRNFLSKN